MAVDGVAAKADALVAALVPLGPAPVAFFDDEAGEIGHAAIAAALLNHEVPAGFEQELEIDFPGGADLPRRSRRNLNASALRVARVSRPVMNGPRIGRSVPRNLLG